MRKTLLVLIVAAVLASPWKEARAGNGLPTSAQILLYSLAVLPPLAVDIGFTVYDVRNLAGSRRPSDAAAAWELVVAVPQLAALGYAAYEATGGFRSSDPALMFIAPATLWVGSLAGHAIWRLASSPAGEQPAALRLVPWGVMEKGRTAGGLALSGTL